MNIKETSVILEAIRSAYPQRVDDSVKEKMLALWSSLLNEVPYEDMQMALKIFIMTDSSGFPPTIGQLMSEIAKSRVSNQLSPEEAWDRVRSAISNGIYGSREEFDGLPPIIQKVVGGASQIYDWAISSNKELQIARSLFLKRYSEALEDEELLLSLPTPVKKHREELAGNEVRRLAEGMLKRIE